MMKNEASISGNISQNKYDSDVTTTEKILIPNPLNEEEKKLINKYRSGFGAAGLKLHLFWGTNDAHQKLENHVDYFLDKVGYSKYHLKLIFINSIIFFVVGCEFVITNIMLSTIGKEWNLPTNQISLLGSSIFIGVFITSVIAGYINNNYGRKVPSVIGCICISIASILCGFAQTVWQLVLIKTFIGMGIGIIIPGLTSLMTESIPKTNRSLVLNAVWGLYPLGIIYICYVGIHSVHRNIFDWRTTCIINSLSTLPMVLLSLYVKESPRYLLLNLHFEDGYKVLNLIGQSNGISLSEEDKEKIKLESIERHNSNEKSNFSSYFEGDLKIISIFLIILWYSSSLISFGLLYVLPKHFENLTKKDKADSFKNMMAAIYILFLCPFIRGYISELKCLGRKNTLALGFLGSFVCSVFCFINENNLSFFSGTLNFFINISLGIVSVYTSEVYSTKLRSGSLGVGNAFTRLGGITAPFICEFMDRYLAKGSFYLFAVCSIFSALISCLLPIETRGIVLDGHIKKSVKSI